MIAIPFTESAMADYRRHCVESWPNEACGYFLDDQSYQRCRNVAEDKINCFVISREDRQKYADRAIGIGHSHTGQILHPTAADIQFQQNTNLDFAVCHTGGKGTSTPIVWGPSVKVPLLGRRWRWGPSGSDNRGDCFACVRDAVLEYTGLAMPDVPRDDEYWRRGQDLVNEWLPRMGWEPVDHPTRYGLVSMAIGHRVEHHLGLIVNEVEMIHHLPPDGKSRSDRLSTQEPMDRYVRFIRRFWRHPDL